MKQRITYLVKDPDTFTPEKLEVKDGSLSLDAVEAVKEHRITFGLDELPAEFRNLITQFPALHLKWTSSKPYSTVPPFTSRAIPGLHILFSPPPSQDALCPLVQVFGSDLKCSSIDETATPVIHTTSAPKPDASLQYNSHLSSLDRAISYIKTSICPPSSRSCEKNAETLLNASYLDVDYTAESDALVVTAFWDAPPGGWTERIPAPTGASTTEVGVLAHEPNPDPEDIAFGGFLTVLGRDTAPKPTRFQTPTSHPPLPPSHSPLTYLTTLPSPTGLHPTLLLTLPLLAPLTPPSSTCTLHTYLTLPSPLFLDRHQYTDPLALASRNLLALRSLHGATDLEAPDWVVRPWGSAAVLDIALPADDDDVAQEKSGRAKAGNHSVALPLHLRYMPAAPAEHARVPVPWPVVFWACDSATDASAANPFHRGALGWEGAFEEGTRFMHVPGATEGEMVEWIDVPVLDTRRAALVEGGTVGVVVLAFVGLCWVLFGGGRKGEKREEKKEQ